MRAIRLLVLLALGLALPGAARAGDFGPPIDFDACGSPNPTEDAMPDAGTAFVSAETPALCASLCKRAGKLCRAYVKDSIACYLRVVANARTFGKLNCESFYDASADAKQCLGQVDDDTAAMIAFLKDGRAQSLDECDLWRDQCLDACAAP